MPLSRRNFLKAAAASVLALWAGKIPHARAAASYTGLRQIVTRDMSSSRTIMWQAHALPQDTHLELRTAADAPAERIDASYTRLDQDDAVNYFFAASLMGLTPGSFYAFRVVWDGAAGPWYPLHTGSAGAKTCTALLLTDSQCADYAVFRRVLDAAVQQHGAVDFLADLGDLTDNGESDWHWRSFTAAMGDAWARLPFAPVMGNHECYGLQWQMCLPTRYLANFVLPPNGSPRFPGYYYDFTVGPVHFFVLNTQFLELRDLRPGLAQEQLLWFRRAAAAAQEPWKVVLMHKDILAYDEYQEGTQTTGGFSDVGNALMPAFDALGIDLVLTGHMHTYRNRGHIYAKQPSDHGPVYVLSGPAGDQTYTVPADPLDKVAVPQPTRNNYLTLEASETALALHAWYVDGTPIDTISLTKDDAKAKAGHPQKK